MTNPAYRAYLESKVLTATPEQLQLMLYEGAIRFSLQAKQAIQEREFERAAEAFVRADAIFLELHNGLRPELDPDLCEKFASLYNFCMRKLQEGHFKHAVGPIDEALTIMQHLRETWQEVLDRIANERSESTILAGAV